MRYRTLGRSFLTVSEIGFGAWGIGGATPGATSYGETDDATSRDALEQAFALGVNFFDTADVYGYGRSERLVGDVFRGWREHIVLASKVGMTRYGEAADFSSAHLERALRGSLARLGTDYLDLWQLHNPPAALADERHPIWQKLASFVRDGRVRALGVSLAAPASLAAFARCAPISVAQINLNMLDRRAVDCGALAQAAANGIGVIARTPLCSGLLTPGVTRATRFDAADHRSRWPASQIARWIDGAEAAFACVAEGAAGQTRPQLALRYCLSYPEVGTVIAGMLTPAEVAENARASDLGPLPDAARAAIESLAPVAVEAARDAA